MSIKKVANLAGVSIATVSRYFSNPDKVAKQTRERVQSAIKEANYWPNAIAQNLRSGKSSVIMLIIPVGGSSLYSALINKLSQLANEINYNLLIKEETYNTLTLGKAENMIRSKQADGFIIVDGLNTAQSEHAASERLPIVLACASKQTNNIELPNISINYYEASYEATSHLLELGHRSLAFISQDQNLDNTQEQEKGFLAAAKTSGASVTIFEHEKTMLSIEEKINLLQSTNSAIVCSDDAVALEAIHFIKQKGLKVPEDISVMGFHNSQFSKLCDPPLTTVENPMTEIGEKAMNILLSIINSAPNESKPASVEHKIIIRQSTCPPKIKP